MGLSQEEREFRADYEMELVSERLKMHRKLEKTLKSDLHKVIKQANRAGYSKTHIAKSLGVTRQTVYTVLKD